MTSLLDDASLPTDIPGLEADLAELKRRTDDCLARIRELMAAEDLAGGVCHAPAIHEAKQLLMMLRYQTDLRLAHRNRLRGPA